MHPDQNQLLPNMNYTEQSFKKGASGTGTGIAINPHKIMKRKINLPA